MLSALSISATEAEAAAANTSCCFQQMKRHCACHRLGSSKKFIAHSCIVCKSTAKFNSPYSNETILIQASCQRHPVPKSGPVAFEVGSLKGTWGFGASSTKPMEGRGASLKGTWGFGVQGGGPRQRRTFEGGHSQCGQVDTQKVEGAREGFGRSGSWPVRGAAPR